MNKTNEFGSWYVRWNTLHYCDKDGHWQEFELDLDWENSDAYKRPKIIDCKGNMSETKDESEDESGDDNCQTLRTCAYCDCLMKGTSDDGFTIDTDGEWWCDTHYQLVKDKYRGAPQIECTCQGTC